MKLFLAMISVLALTSSCNEQDRRITQTGFLVLDGSRNHTSFDYFIPCPINDTLTLLENIRLLHPSIALNMRQDEKDFDIMRNSWGMTANEIYPDSSNHDKKRLISAVEITYKKEDSNREIVKSDTAKLGGFVLSKKLQISPWNKTISVKQFILSRH